MVVDTFFGLCFHLDRLVSTTNCIVGNIFSVKWIQMFGAIIIVGGVNCIGHAEEKDVFL